MRKVIIAFDGSHFSKGAFELACRLNEQETILLIGTFLPELDLAGLGYAYSFGGGGVYIPLQETVDEGIVDENINQFKYDCVKQQIEFRVHKDHSPYAITALQKESRFADLMIIGSQQFYDNLKLEVPNEYLRDILHDTECPVIVAPEQFDYPENIVLAYDGSRSSVYAIKMFAYLFPDLCKRPTTLVYANVQHVEDMPDEDYIEELAGRHFSDLEIMRLDLRDQDTFQTWMEEVPKPILVSGAFGRSGLSNIFKKSFVTHLISDYKYPVFIAHH